MDIGGAAAATRMAEQSRSGSTTRGSNARGQGQAVPDRGDAAGAVDLALGDGLVKGSIVVQFAVVPGAEFERGCVACEGCWGLGGAPLTGSRVAEGV